ncbi:farnesol dehydrogenase-like [Cotesia typhae]|uniref:farnesol dehydrogenase-like n=1 Tax=Cotesia typhae TaxID=2053667 RepID=UPI003D69CED8
MDRWVGKSAIVTGVSSGIGEVIVEKLVCAGVNVLGLARREDRLQALAQRFKGAKGKFHYLKCDLRNEPDILKAFACAEKTFGCLDILVNNAGVFFVASFDAAKTEDYRSIMDINVLAPAICIREALKLMRKHKNDGHIININSVAGHHAVISEVPMNLYPASKFALRAMTDTLKGEIKLKQDKIRITGIHPGLVKTEILNSFGDKTNELLNKMPYMESKDVADCVIFALSMPRNVQIDELTVTAIAV